MRLEDAVVFPADLPVADAVRRLDRLPERATIVVVREEPTGDYYYAFPAGAVAFALARAPAEVELTTALGLHEWSSLPVMQLADFQAGPVATPTVLLDGDQVLGVAVPSNGGDRGESTPSGTVGSAGRDEVDRDASSYRSVPAATRDGSPFRAFPRLTAPDATVTGVPFDLEVGLDREIDPAARSAAPILIADAPPMVPFVVQVLGFGFTFPEGVRRELAVPHDDPGRSTVSFKVVAEPVRRDVVRVLEVSYEYAGNVCGRAWREIHVGAAGQPAPAEPPRAGGTGVAPPPLALTPHLTLEIRSRQGDPELEWLFHSRYTDLDFPTMQVTTGLAEGSAKEFAVQIMAQLPAQQGSPFLDDAVRGLGRRVAAAMPPELWPLLDTVWARADAAGETPTLLIQTNEPYVPWELAWLDGDYVDRALLPDVKGGTLGQLWQVGRWIPPIARTPRGGDRPPSPPVTRMDVEAMAVVIGDYASDAQLRPLPEAIKEGNEIALRYRALPLKAIEADMARLMDNALVRNGVPFAPRVVHMAAHGQVAPDMQQYTGIILSGTGRRLDPLVVQGSWLSRDAQPFVFLNACQVGTAGMVLSEYGGLAAAFLTEGCRGFLAPLWNVDDAVAREFALAFYKDALGSGRPVAEVLRELRGRFGTPWSAGTATPLAYVFYGHPALTLNLP